MIDDRSAVATFQTIGWIKIHALMFGCKMIKFLVFKTNENPQPNKMLID